ncbi:MAG: ATP-binding cassette domain-containing protein [Chloroflexi bacterium]|nr:ATP-binding cassette domain-containing protein [Chloroflexota bacterium]
MPILETDALTKRFNHFTAVDAVSLSAEAGEVLGVVGPNGAGKTTTVKMLTTLLQPTSGAATVAGFDVVKKSGGVRRSIGYVPQLLSADGQLTGHENLLIFAKLYDIPRRERDELIPEALSFMGLTDAADRLVRTYSGGMIRRLEIAEATLHRPRVLFLDEPTLGLDPVARRAVWDRIMGLRDTYGTTIVLTTHYMEEADSLCDRVAIMHQGKVVAMGSPEELKVAVGGNGATLEDVFAHFTGSSLDSRGSYSETSRTRRAARRFG